MSVWVDEDLPVGRMFLFERRYWLAFFEISDQVDFRKKQARKNTLSGLSQVWGLGASAFVAAEPPFKTLVINSSLLLAWLFYKRNDFKPDRQGKVDLALGSYFGSVCAGFSKMTGQPPSLSLSGMSHSVAPDGNVDFNALLNHILGLLSDWGFLRESGLLTPLGALPPDDRLPLRDLLVFVEARVRLTQGCPAWLTELRNALLQLASFGYELEVFDQLRRIGKNVEIMQLFTKTGRRVAREHTRKARLLEDIDKIHGSNEVVAQSVLPGSNGGGGGLLRFVLCRIRSTCNAPSTDSKAPPCWPYNGTPPRMGASTSTSASRCGWTLDFVYTWQVEWARESIRVECFGAGVGAHENSKKLKTTQNMW